MKLAYFKDGKGNFGDDLNAWMWPKLLPEGFFDDDERELFVGIGSIIGEGIFPKSSRKLVFGAGYGGYWPAPDSGDKTWEFFFVRGRDTARICSIPEEKAICDGAILLAEINNLPKPCNRFGIAFMPHYQSVVRGNWQQVCKRAGITLLDPTEPVETLLSKIRGADLIVTEAMHGAIVSDVFRTQWIAVKPLSERHHRKWGDWAGSLDLKIAWENLPPSSVPDLILLITGRGESRLNKIWLGLGIFTKVVDCALICNAAHSLRRILRRNNGQLSNESTILQIRKRAKRTLDEFVRGRLTSG